MACTLALALFAAGCGAASTGDSDGDSDVDADTDTDGDADTDGDTDTDSGFPPCPDDPDIPITNLCESQADCDPSECDIAGGVCVEQQWVCGDCGRCFYKRINHLDPPDGWACDADRVHCVHR